MNRKYEFKAGHPPINGEDFNPGFQFRGNLDGLLELMNIMSDGGYLDYIVAHHLVPLNPDLWIMQLEFSAPEKYEQLIRDIDNRDDVESKQIAIDGMHRSRLWS